MASPSVTYTFANSTTADATQVNTNFTDLINGMSDGTKDFSINALTCAGAATLNGNVNIGNASSDDLTVTASLASSLAIKTTFAYDVGAATLGLKSIYLGSNDSAAKSVRLIAGAVGTSYTFTLPTSGGTDDYVLKTNGSGTTSWRAWTLPTIQKFAYTDGSTQTYTTPANVKWIRVRMVGGGGGGAGGGHSGTFGNGGAGGNTFFRVGASPDLLVANGGAGGTEGSQAAGGTASLGTGPIGIALSGATGAGFCFVGSGSLTGASGPGGNGGSSPFGGAGMGTANAAGTSAVAGTGSGGGGGAATLSATTNSRSGAGGGAGGYVDAIITSPNATYSYSVGVGGAGGTSGTNGSTGGAGGSGYIIVEEHYQ